MSYDRVDFSECDFIHSAMKFYTYDDFITNCFIIKQRFKKLSKNGKLFYMWYLYANIHITLIQKNKIWDYLNEYINKEQLIESKDK